MTLQAAPLIVTLKLDEDSFMWLDNLRQQHFPPERNFLSAHLTLFHHMPAEQLNTLKTDLSDITAEMSALSLTFSEPMFIGRGVAIRVICEPLIKLRARLAAKWRPWLTAQDNQGFRPHVTVQNKVSPAVAGVLYQTLQTNWNPRQGTGLSLSLWHYYGGPWQHHADFSLNKTDE